MAYKKSFTEKRKKFCEEYVADLNAKAAALRAGYAPAQAGVQGHQLLQDPEVKAYIAKLQGKISKKLEITAERVLEELARIGFSNIQDFIEENNEPKSIKSVDPDKAKAVSYLEVFHGKEGTSTKIKMHDKIAALASIAKHIGFYEADNKQRALDAENVIRIEIVPPKEE